MSRDINLTVLYGTVTSEPIVVAMKNGKPKLTFTLSVAERYKLSDGTPAEHINALRIEVLGRNVHQYRDTIRLNKRYMIHGYLRSEDSIDGRDKISVRCYSVQADD